MDIIVRTYDGDGLEVWRKLPRKMGPLTVSNRLGGLGAPSTGGGCKTRRERWEGQMADNEQLTGKEVDQDSGSSVLRRRLRQWRCRSIST